MGLYGLTMSSWISNSYLTYQPFLSKIGQFHCEVHLNVKYWVAKNPCEPEVSGALAGNTHLDAPSTNLTSGMISFPFLSRAFEMCIVARTDATAIHRLP